MKTVIVEAALMSRTHLHQAHQTRNHHWVLGVVIGRYPLLRLGSPLHHQLMGPVVSCYWANCHLQVSLQCQYTFQICSINQLIFSVVLSNQSSHCSIQLCWEMCLHILVTSGKIVIYSTHTVTSYLSTCLESSVTPYYLEIFCKCNMVWFKKSKGCFLTSMPIFSEVSKVCQ